MKQIVDKLNKIAKKIDESVEIPQTDLIIDSLDAITKAYGGTPNDSHLIVDKLEDIYNNIGSGGGGGVDLLHTTVNIVNNSDSAYIPTMILFGYAVKLSDINPNYEDVLYCNTISGSYGVDLSDLTVSVPRNSTLTFNAYYLNGQISEYGGGIMIEDTNTTATNMSYADGGWSIVDTTENSTLTNVVVK